MTQMKQKIVTEETTVGEPDNSPSVVAYRVGELEKAVTKGFADAALQIKESGERQTAQIKEIVDGFVTEKEMIEAKSEAKAEHLRIWKEIDAIKAWGSWAIRIVGGALILGLLVALGFKAGLGG